MADIPGDTNDGDANDAAGVLVDILSSLCCQMSQQAEQPAPLGGREDANYNDNAIRFLQRQASASSSVSAFELHVASDTRMVHETAGLHLALYLNHGLGYGNQGKMYEMYRRRFAKGG